MLFFISLRSALKYKKLSNAKFSEVFKSFFAMLRGDDLTIAQTIMSANSPAIIQRAMVEGNPDHGAMPSGQVAGVIDSTPSCQNLIHAIMDQYNDAISNLSK